jgi:hypothetical protein
MRYEISLLIAIIILMVSAILMHTAYLQRIRVNLVKTSESAFKMKDLKQAMKIPQGSNYNTLVISSWSLYFVALIFLYFLTPRVFPNFNFFNYPKVASNEIGLLILAVVVIAITVILASAIPQSYSYYTFSKNLKNLTIYSVPILLLISLLSSSYLATIFPLASDMAWNLGFVTLTAALIVLILPIISGFVEVLR